MGGVLSRSFFDFGMSAALFSVFLGAVMGAMYYFLKIHKAAFFAGLFLFSAGLGILRYDMKETRSMALENEIGSKISFRAVIIDEPEEKENYARLIVEERKNRVKVLLTAYSYPEFHYGDIVDVFGILKRPEKYTPSTISEQAGFDWPAYLAKEDIYYEMVYPQINLVSSGGGFWLKRWLFGVKEKFIASLSANIPEPNAGFLAGLTIGAKTAIPKELLESFRKTGIIHIVVLSGYNITLVADVVIKMLGVFPFYFGISFGILGIFLFALMTGASATVVRASIMAGIVLFAKATGRIYHITIALLVAGFFMVLHNPKILRFDSSFQLSFLATLALIYVSPHVEKKMTFIPKKFHLREITTATISTQIFVMPFLLYKMGLFSAVSLPVNLLVLIFVPLTMIFGFLAGIAGFISQILSIPFAWVGYTLTAYELRVVDLFSKLPFAAFNISIPFWMMIFIYAGYIIMLLKLRDKKVR